MFLGLTLAITPFGNRSADAEAGGFFSALFNAFGGHGAGESVGDLNNSNRSAPIVRRKKKRTDFSGGQAICVRLCDGYAFPTNASLGEAACTAACPDASSAIYFLRGGPDKIANSVSSRGEPYTALPVALRYRTMLDSSCTCHRSSPSNDLEAILRDLSLRKGDVVMTERGFVLFSGEPHQSKSEKDLIPLARAGLGQESRAILFAMERAVGTDWNNQNLRSPSQPLPLPLASGADPVVGGR